MTKEFYVQYGNGNTPMLTQRIHDVQVHELAHHKAGLQYTATGYGDKLPTIYKIKVQGRWRRVYSRCHSTVSSEYIIINGVETRVTIN